MDRKSLAVAQRLMEPVSSDARRLAARLAARAEIRDIRLFKSDIELVDFAPPSGHLRYNIDIDTETNREPGADRFVLKCTYNLVIEPAPSDDDEDDEGDHTVARLTFELGGLFSLDDRAQSEELAESEFEAFSRTTGQMALWPFAREYVFDTTGRLGLPPLAIGVFRVPLDSDEVSVELLEPSGD